MNEKNTDSKSNIDDTGHSAKSPAGENIPLHLSAAGDKASFSRQEMDQHRWRLSSGKNHLQSQPSIKANPLILEPGNIPQLLARLKSQELLIVNPRRKNGLIIYKKYHAEFAGPGAIVGGLFDLGVTTVLAVGSVSLVDPQNSQEKKQAYKMRRQWVRLTKQIIDNPQPTERAQVILNQFEHWFDVETVADLPDEAFALLVGVLPQTIRKVRNIELL